MQAWSCFLWLGQVRPALSLNTILLRGAKDFALIPARPQTMMAAVDGCPRGYRMSDDTLARLTAIIAARRTATAESLTRNRC